MVQITHWYTWTRGKMAVMSTPSSNGFMPKHLWLGWRWSWIRDFSRTITYVNFFDKPLERIGFNHRWGWCWLNGCKTVNSRTKTVTGIGSNSICFSHNRWTTGKSWLSCPNFVPLFWNFWGFDLWFQGNFFGFMITIYDLSFLMILLLKLHFFICGEL